MRYLRVIALAALTSPLAGCLVGPDYRGPDSAAPLAESGFGFRRASLAPVKRVEPSSQWWLALKDPLLTQLIEKGFAESSNIEMARAKVRQARATTRQQAANLYPDGQLDGAFIYSRMPLGQSKKAIRSAADKLKGNSRKVANDIASRLPDALDTRIYDTNFAASWELDIFGGQRRAVEQAAAQAQADEAALADTYVQLAAQIAQSYANLRDAQRRLGITQRSVGLQQESLDLTIERRKNGTAADTDVERLRTQLEQTAASAEPFKSTIDQALNQIAALVGFEPGVFDKELQRPKALPRLPGSFPVGDPAGVLRRRPDIREAERDLAATNAQIGQAVAGYFPKVTLIGNVGTVAFSAKDYGKTISETVGPTLQWDVLDFGRNAAKVDQATAGTQAAFAQYKNTVLSALQDAENSLSQFGRTRAQVGKLARARNSAARASSLTRESNKAGTVSTIDLLNVEQQRIQSELNLAQAQAQLFNYYVLIQKSLGLGWKEEDIQPKAAGNDPI